MLSNGRQQPGCRRCQQQTGLKHHSTGGHCQWHRGHAGHDERLHKRIMRIQTCERGKPQNSPGTVLGLAPLRIQSSLSLKAAAILISEYCTIDTSGDKPVKGTTVSAPAELRGSCTRPSKSSPRLHILLTSIHKLKESSGVAHCNVDKLPGCC